MTFQLWQTFVMPANAGIRVPFRFDSEISGYPASAGMTEQESIQ
jgi:hypothetical protein